MTVAPLPAFDCPSCAGPMHRQSFARRPDGRVEIDLCFDCQSMWLDHYESSQLTPGATIELFRLIHDRAAANARPIAETADCPACRRRLRLTHDIQGTNRFMYYRCPERHGRLITFFHFLREKHFVRSLSGVEVERLKATVSQVRCSSCGATVHVERDAACAHCRTPLAILDTDSVRETLAQLGAAESRRIAPADEAAAAVDAIIAGRRVERRLAYVERDSGEGRDLLRAALDFLMTEP